MQRNVFMGATYRGRQNIWALNLMTQTFFKDIKKILPTTQVASYATRKSLLRFLCCFVVVACKNIYIRLINKHRCMFFFHSQHFNLTDVHRLLA
ncbi:CLUMA_CG019851, isoform A [Clunio marinus]|uniref:CLUMA_CG019851, isoform A n=1 Tax=Clunio marinus TaxID=568069 RepID=A0A1J1J3W5_9DIPT|nr:CLUMA_CG019851, isoform A [Clunio marinus]